MNRLPERFRAKIELVWTRHGQCWMWDGWNSGDGYGKVWFDGRAQMAHRVVYELLVGPIPDGLKLDHVCRNRGCCNPAHVEPVTTMVNTLRGDAVLFRRNYGE